eukprot:COSAG04_NODE_3663_length_2625_cov_2.644497_1_plen_205_part_10
MTVAAPEKSKGDVLHVGTFVGLVDNSQAEPEPSLGRRLWNSRGVWGLRATNDHQALRADGESYGAVLGNGRGVSFGCGERIGMLVDNAAHTVQIYRDGARVEGAVLSGLPSSLRVAVDLCGRKGSTARMAFPPAPGELLEKMEQKVEQLESQLKVFEPEVVDLTKEMEDEDRDAGTTDVTSAKPGQGRSDDRRGALREVQAFLKR